MGALTPNSSLTPYATYADLFARYDLRTIGDLVGDAGSRVGGSPVPTPATLGANASVVAALAEASGWVEAACLRGQRYAPADLAALTGNSQAFLVGIVCALAMGVLFRHKFQKNPTSLEWSDAQDLLAQLAAGEMIFAFAETEAAGVLTDQVETADDVTARNLTSAQAGRLFGRRGDRLGAPGNLPSWARGC